MSTTKIVAIVLSIAAVLGLIVVLFVGGIAWFTFRTIGSSQAADEARAYLRTNQKLKDGIGEVKDFGSFVTGSINVHNQDGDATLKLKVYGERKTVSATVDLMYRSNRDWRVTGARYESDGRTVDLMSAYSEPSPPPE
ncbi:MAG TPA: cytochrome c oxidase assembly factor Coa1 family protein [Pyrinomonadaceae bacterium]|nr:cytochrome c oxidase assembly factor Coa1 family protein [Pyrinomonadaceae bacterium]